MPPPMQPTRPTTTNTAPDQPGPRWRQSCGGNMPPLPVSRILEPTSVFSGLGKARGKYFRPWKIQSHTCAGVRLMA